MKPGTTVAFSQAVIRRTYGEKTAKARGVVLSIKGNLAKVDFKGTWEEHEDGGTVRTVPIANLTVVLPNGAVFGD